MKCPVCKDTNLVMSDRQGVEIDYCSSCRGVWLDRGELDKIIERSSQPNHSGSYQQNSYKNQHHSSEYDSHQNGYSKRKKESFLSELFDF